MCLYVFDYSGELKRVLPFETQMVVVTLTGAQLSEWVRYSRTVMKGKEFGGYLQVRFCEAVYVCMCVCVCSVKKGC